MTDDQDNFTAFVIGPWSFVILCYNLLTINLNHAEALIVL